MKTVLITGSTDGMGKQTAIILDRGYASDKSSFHVFLTLNLLSVIKPVNAEPARIINVSSMAHASKMDFDNLIKPAKYDGHRAYSLSRLCSIYFTIELSEGLKYKNITVNCLHPGVINTKLLRAGWGGIGGFFGSGLSKGAKTSVYLAVSKEVESITGKYFSDSKIAKPRDIAYDKDARAKLWRLSEELINRNIYEIV